MPRDSPRTTVRVDDDGVRIVRTPGIRREIWLLCVALVTIAVALLMFRRGTPQPAAEERMARSAAPAGGANVAPRSRLSVQLPMAPDARGEQPVVPPRPEEGAQPSAAVASDSSAAERADTGEPSGIALFPPMGTKPIKRGIIVPDDFPLPPGYVRHHQVTDDGEPLPAILMFHPDYHPLDEHGQPVALPKDLVVPPDMAPPGLAIKMLDVPDDSDPAARQAGEEPEPAR